MAMDIEMGWGMDIELRSKTRRVLRWRAEEDRDGRELELMKIRLEVLKCEISVSLILMIFMS